MSARRPIREVLGERIMVLDGAMGTMILARGLGEEDFRGEMFASSRVELRGCNDLLNLTQEDVVRSIHRLYLDAGADIITSNTFNANRLSMADYQLEESAADMAYAGARLAHEEVERFMAEQPLRECYAAGSIGPTNMTASIAVDVNDTERCDVMFGQLVEVFAQQIDALVRGGVDMLLFETFFDMLNCKAAIYAAQIVSDRLSVRLPIIVSGTLTRSGCMLSGQSVEAFYTSVAHAEPLAVGFNCSFGADNLLPYVERLAAVSEFPVSVYPNAGLPDQCGCYSYSPDDMEHDMEEYMRRGVVNIVGGCCGTRPEHIARLANLAREYRPRAVPQRRHN